MARRGYPPELRHEALRLVASGQSVFQVARQLGISVQVIYSWRKQAATRLADEPAAGERD